MLYKFKEFITIEINKQKHLYFIYLNEIFMFVLIYRIKASNQNGKYFRFI